MDNAFWTCRCDEKVHPPGVGKCDRCGLPREDGDPLTVDQALSWVARQLTMESDLPSSEAVEGEYVRQDQKERLHHLASTLHYLEEMAHGRMNAALNTHILPENPCHTKDLDDIEKLRSMGFEGPDANLSISLHEHGIIWRRIAPEEVLFVYLRPRTINFSGPKRYDRCTMMRGDIDFQLDWVNWDEVLGEDESLEDMPLEQIFWRAFNYHGPMEVFGESNWGGFTIADPEDERFLQYLTVDLRLDTAGRDNIQAAGYDYDDVFKCISDTIDGLLDDSESVCEIDLDLVAGELTLKMNLNEQRLRDRWPRADDRTLKDLMTERVAHGVSTALKSMKIGWVNLTEQDFYKEGY